MDKLDIPRKTIYRLSIYYRCLLRLHENGMKTVSSNSLSQVANVKSSQLRKDLGYFGQLGTRGLGYPVELLLETLRDVLGHATLQPVVLVGVGNLGRALLHYEGFKKEGFEVLSAFDVDPTVLNGKDLPVPVRHDKEMVSFVRENNVRMAILCVPAQYGQEVANELVNAGVQGILNFSPTILQVPDHVIVTRVDLAMELESLSYFIDQ